MNITHLHIEHLKLFKDFDLSFVRPDGGHYEWTVLIGENGTGKTSILQAIAMAAAGQVQVNSLAERLTHQLRDRRGSNPMEIRADFAFTTLPSGMKRQYAGASLESLDALTEVSLAVPSGVTSTVSLASGETTFFGSSSYKDYDVPVPNPVDTARAKNLPHWFVVGYGVGRYLPEASDSPALKKPSIERLQSLFPTKKNEGLTSTGFLNYFSGDDSDARPVRKSDKALLYSRLLKRALLDVESLLPAITHIELRGHGGVRKAGDLQERDRIKQRLTPTEDINLPMEALSHGYQSTMAWIADLIGQVIFETQGDLKLDDLRGLVLIDELDLFLHPTWQVVLVHALRKTFPHMQFVVSTHSPLVLAGLRPDHDQIVRLRVSPTTGSIERVSETGDPRLMTGTELLRTYFNIDDIHPDKAGRDLRDYRYIAANPFRSDADDRTLATLRSRLDAQGIDPKFSPVPREPQ